MPQDSPRVTGLMPLVDTVGYSIQTCWLRQLSLKPLLIIHQDCKTLCGLIQDGLFTNWQLGFDCDPRLHDLQPSRT